MPEAPELEFLTLAEVAALARVSRASIYRLVERRELPALRLVNRLRFRRQVVLDWLKAAERPSTRARSTGRR